MGEPKTELQRNAIDVARRKELETFQRALDVQWLNNRMDDGRTGRCLALIKREAEMEKDFQERTDHAAIVNAKAAKETALGKEIATIKNEETAKLLRRHYLRERDPSLRELMKKLQAGYVCRDQKQQILHNEYKRLQDKVEEQRANSVLLKALYNNQEQAVKEETEAIERKGRYCKELQEQLVSRQRQRHCEYEESLIEKKMLDDIMRTIYDEDMRELKQHHEQREKLRYEMKCSLETRQQWKEKQKKQLLDEERAIEEQIKAAGDRSTAIIEARELKNKQKDELNERIAKKIQADEAARMERINVIGFLQEQEALEQNWQDDRNEKEKAERVKRETKEALTAQMENKKQEALQQKERDAKFRDASEAKYKMENDKEKNKEEKLKQKRQLYAQQLKKQIEDNAVRRKKEKELEDKRVQNVWDYHKSWSKEVSNERKRLIEEHGGSVIGSLQTGVLQPPDVALLPSGLRPPEDHPPRTPVKPKCNAQCRVIKYY